MVKRGPCYGLKHQKEKRSMDHFAGLDVSVKDTSVCIVDDTGRITREVKVASEPDALLTVLKNPVYRFKRIGLEAGPLSQWLFSALAEAGLPVICVETRHMRAVLKAQINKTDRNDARGIAQMMRVGLYRPVHVKTLRSQKLRMLLTHRKLLQSKAIAIENDLRATLRNFGLKGSATRHGHPRQTHCTGLAVAEFVCRAVDRDPSRVRGPHRRAGRGASAPDPARVCSLLQYCENAPVIGPGCASLSPCVVRSVIVLTDFAITDVTTAHVTERNEPPPTLVPKREAHAAKALEERESTCSDTLRVFAQHLGQPEVWDSATKMMDVVHADIGRKPA